MGIYLFLFWLLRDFYFYTNKYEVCGFWLCDFILFFKIDFCSDYKGRKLCYNYVIVCSYVYRIDDDDLFLFFSSFCDFFYLDLLLLLLLVLCLVYNIDDGEIRYYDVELSRAFFSLWLVMWTFYYLLFFYALFVVIVDDGLFFCDLGYDAYKNDTDLLFFCCFCYWCDYYYIFVVLRMGLLF